MWGEMISIRKRTAREVMENRKDWVAFCEELMLE